MAKSAPLVITIFVCGDVEARWHAYLAEQSERDWRAHEHEQFEADQLGLQAREPELCDMRSDTDPHWPDRGIEQFEEAERDPALVYK